EGRAPVKMADAVIMSYLKRLSLDDFLASPDVSEGLETRLLRAVANTSTLSDAADCAKTKRYTHSRIRRALLTAFLGITRAEVSQNPSYARVLAFNNTGRNYNESGRCTRN
ncbi:MAG: nucleotidyltransferase family protein, partial [Clostridia bacterium]